MSLQSGGAKVVGLGKTGLGGGGGWMVAGRGAGRCSSVGRVCWKGATKVLVGVLALEGGFQQGFSKGIQRRKGFLQGFQQGLQQGLYHPFHLHSVLF